MKLASEHEWCSGAYLVATGDRARSGQEHRKGCAFTGLAGDLDLAPQERRKFAHNREAQARPTVTAAIATVGLIESLEYALLLLR